MPMEALDGHHQSRHYFHDHHIISHTHMPMEALDVGLIYEVNIIIIITL